MKILFTTESYYPDVCGVSNVVTNLAEGLVKLGHDVTVFTENRKRDYIQYNCVKIHEFDVKGNIITGYKGEIKKYQKEIVEFECDVIINECAQIWCSDLAFDVIDKIKAKKVFHSHGYSVLTFPPKNPINKYRFYKYFKKIREVLKKYDHIFYLSNVNEDKIFGDRYCIPNYSILPNGVEDEFLQIPSHNETVNSYKKYNIELNNQILINIANYSSLKNQEATLREVYKLKTSFTMIFIGLKKNEYLDKLLSIKVKLDKQFGFKDVKFLYEVPREDIKNMLYGADLFIYSSKREAFPLVVVEAIATITPFISSNVGNLSEYHNKFGVTSNIKYFHQKIDELLSDVSKIDEFKHNCMKYRKETAWSQKVKLIENKLIEVLENDHI